MHISYLEFVFSIYAIFSLIKSTNHYVFYNVNAEHGARKKAVKLLINDTNSNHNTVNCRCEYSKSFENKII